MPASSDAIMRGAVQSSMDRDIGFATLFDQAGPNLHEDELFKLKIDEAFPSQEVDNAFLSSEILGVFIERKKAADAIEAKRQEQGGGFGAPTTALLAAQKGDGYFRHFEHGSVFWHPRFGACEVHGAIRDKYASLGWEASYLGYPDSDEQGRADGTRYGSFEGGVIEWDGTAAFIDFSLVAHKEKTNVGFTIHISGKGATPGGAISLQVEGLEGRVGPYPMGVVLTGLADGRYGSYEWVGHTWNHQFSDATLRATDKVSGKTDTASIPALY